MTAIDGSPAARRLEWQRAEVREIVVETSRVKSLRLHVAGWRGHLPGQHVDIRLTAEDGYQAQRSYSIASPPEDELLAITVERVDNGEVSPICSKIFAWATTLNCAGRSEAISSGPHAWAARSISSRAEAALRR